MDKFYVTTFEMLTCWVVNISGTA